MTTDNLRAIDEVSLPSTRKSVLAHRILTPLPPPPRFPLTPAARMAALLATVSIGCFSYHYNGFSEWMLNFNKALVVTALIQLANNMIAALIATWHTPQLNLGMLLCAYSARSNYLFVLCLVIGQLVVSPAPSEIPLSLILGVLFAMYAFTITQTFRLFVGMEAALRWYETLP